MSGNFTLDEKLVYLVSDKGWLANPAGIEGYDVVVVEKKAAEGTCYYTTLRPGETLRLGARFFGRYQAYAVDMRSGRSFHVTREFTTAERNRTASLKANVRYQVMDSKKVALDTVDPLGELSDKVTATLARELARWPQERITHDVCEKIILSVGGAEALGLTITGAEVLDLNGDRVVATRQSDIEQAQHVQRLRQMQEEDELRAQQAKARADLEIKRALIDGIDLRDPNALMHIHPETIEAVLNLLVQRQAVALDSQRASQDVARKLIAATMETYIAQQSEGESFDPNVIADMVRDQLLPPGAIGPVPGVGQITFGEGTPNMSSGRIEFGGELPSGPAEEKKPGKRIQFGDESK